MLKRLAFATVASLLVLAACEGMAHLAPATYTVQREVLLREMANSPDLVTSENVPGWDISADGGTQWKTTYNTNVWHMRGPDYDDPAAANVRRAIFVGDSSIFGVLLDWPDTFSARFERMREREDPGTDWQVANCACPGHSTIQSIAKLEHQCLAFKPNLVIIGNQFSDSTLGRISDDERFALSSTTLLARGLEHLASYRILRNTRLRMRRPDLTQNEEIPQVGGRLLGTVRRVTPEAYGANLVTMIEMVRAAGATPALLMLAAQQDVAAPTGKSAASEYREQMRRVAAETGVVLVDAPTAFVKAGDQDGLFADHVHPGPTGAGLLAILLHNQLPK